MTVGERPSGVVGRERELSELEKLLGGARAGRPALVVVEGPAGIGKTVLLERFLAEHDDLARAHVVAMPWESSIEFGVAERLLRALEHRDLPLERRDRPDGSEIVDAANRLLRCWSDGAESAIVVVEDAHWADITSLRMLSSAFRRMNGESVLIVLVARDGRGDVELGVAAEVHEHLARHDGPRIRPDPLTAAQIQALAIRSVGVDLTMSAARQLADHTAGNPRHTERLLHEVPAETWLEWQPTLPAPEDLATGVAHVLNGCGSAARTLIDGAAVCGPNPSLAEVAELTGTADPIVALNEAAQAGLLHTGGDLTTLSFPSPMVRAAVYAELAPARRRELHVEAARLTDDEGSHLMHRVSAAPFADAGLADELDEFAGRQAARGAWTSVGNALINASKLSPARVDRERRLIRAVDALVGAGDLPRALAFSPAIESFSASCLRDAVLGYLAILLGRPGEAEQLLQRAWQNCDPARDPDAAALICQRRVLHSMGRWNGQELVTWSRRAVSLASGPQDPPVVESEAILGLGLAAMGRIKEAEDAYAKVAAKVDPSAQSQRVRMGKGWLDLARDDPQTARGELESAVPMQYRRGSVRISLWAQAWLARAEFVLGNWDEAIHTVDRAAVQLDRAGIELVRPLVHWTGTQAHALRGDWNAADEHLRRASVTADSYEIMLLPACLARAQYSEARADYESVIRALEPLVRLRIRQGIDEPGFWPWQDVYANALVMTNRVAEADAFLAPHEHVAAVRGHRSTMARLGYVRGRIAGALGDIESARESFEGALGRLAGLPLPYDRARVNFAYGQTLRRAGKRKEADSVLRDARDAYVSLGARAYVRRCDRELNAAKLKSGHSEVDAAVVESADGSGVQLTAQERSVAELVAGGMSNKQVAVELFLSVKTVQYHLTRIYAKFGIRSRGELAARFREEDRS